MQRQRKTFFALHRAINTGLVRACHDLSEGGLAAAVAEMAFAGELGAHLALDCVPHDLASGASDMALLFSESNSRFLCEVRPDKAAAFEAALAGVPHARLGEVVAERRLEVRGLAASGSRLVIAADLQPLKDAWQQPFRW